MVLRKTDYFMKMIPEKTYEIGDIVTICHYSFVNMPKLPWAGGYSEIKLLGAFGGEKFKVVSTTTRSIKGYEALLYEITPVDESLQSKRYSYIFRRFIFGANVFKESYRYDKKKD